MSTARWEDVRRAADERRRAAGMPVPTAQERRERVDKLIAEVRAFQLAEIRREQSLTQRNVAESMGVSPPRVSAIEHGEADRIEVATLRSYVEALGGRLRVLADFGDVHYTIA
jgi:DNA-binding XRE family transcriptional regulator